MNPSKHNPIESNYTNRLAKEKSPYLIQHSKNPVDWYPWGKEAFEKAAKENKPIFLSIGYSTCHWCHVMEKESFEDKEVAKLINETFVPIKVDREERPDIDNIYMSVCQMMTGSGGWPLTIIMTPSQKPFFAGTYFPKTSMYGRIGLIDLISRVKDAWAKRQNEVLKSADEAVLYLNQINNHTKGYELNENDLKSAFEQLNNKFDKDNGGFGQAPKFPTPHILSFLLRYWKRTGNPKAVFIVEKTLMSMRQGGIYDHIGFGFHRYSTDAKWLVPHFEKMLYDQALLAMCYTETYQATGNTEYKNTAEEILSYAINNMLSKEGGFYCAEDADSEGEEGKFYTWEYREIINLLTKEEATVFTKVFNIDKSGNFLNESTGTKNGLNIIHISRTIDEISSQINEPVDKIKGLVESSRQKLLKARQLRVKPQKDDKILTDWNGLMISALSKAGQAFDKAQYITTAQKSADFIIKKLQKPNGALNHRYRDNQSDIEGNLDDYAFMIQGFLDLYESTFDTKYLNYAINLNKILLNHFWDKNSGGFYFTSDNAEQLIARSKEIYDGAIPSGNSVSALNLLRLAKFTSNSDFYDKAVKTITAFSTNIHQMPSVFTQMMVAVDFLLGPSSEVVIAGKTEDQNTTELIRAIRESFIPNKIVVFRPVDEDKPAITGIAKYTANYKDINGKATVYICTDNSCKTPTNDKNEMLNTLNIKKQ